MEYTRSIAELLRYIEKHYQKDKALAERGPQGWFYYSHQKLLIEVKALALYLHSIGIKKGDMVGIVALSGIRWVIADLAIMACGAITVPVFANIASENFLFECQQTDVKTVFVSGPDAWKAVGSNRELFKQVIALDAPPADAKAITFEDAIQKGSSILKEKPESFDKLLDQIKENDVATIVYTSSSTGVPKGVILTHKNILFSGFINYANLEETDRVLSFLPLAHIYMRIVTLVGLRWNVGIYFLNDPKEAEKAFHEIKPTMTSLIPRTIEKIYAKMVMKVNEAGYLKRAIGHWAFNIALDVNFENHLFHTMADKLVYQKLRDAYGGKLRMILTGSAPINPTLIHFFNHIGIPLVEGYGMTEMMIISSNTLEDSKPGTVGKPYPGVEVKISEEGEVLVRSDGVMQGYYKNPEATKEALDKDGWLHTNDKGSLDSDGYISIVGRMKDIVKSSTGEWIVPHILEEELEKAPFVGFALAIAENRKFVSVLIFPDFDVLNALKISQNLGSMSDEEFLNSPYIQREMDQLIANINAHHNHWEQIHAYRFVLKHPSIESGELTPTMKIRRPAIMKKYKKLIDSMYENSEEQKRSVS